MHSLARDPWVTYVFSSVQADDFACRVRPGRRSSSVGARDAINVGSEVAQYGGEVFWLTAACFGAGGGFVVSAVAFCADVHAWQEERHRQRRARMSPLPKLTQFMDPWADLLALLTRIALGGMAGYVFHGEVVGNTAAMAVGAAAPALLAQFGKQTFPDFISEPKDKSTGNTETEKPATEVVSGRG